MKKVIFLLISVMLLVSCQKTVEKVKEKVGYSILTGGQWKVSSYQKNTDDITGDFAPYLFQFKEDGTVDAIKNGTVEKTGNWTTDQTSKTITATYTPGNTTLVQLNGTWTFIDAGLTFVIATQTSGSNSLKLRLDKQ